MLEEVGFSEIEIKPINATWAIFGMHLVRILDSRRLTRVLVPLLNCLFSYLDKRSLLRWSNQTNVMSYEVKALKK
jgi:hypothetical protein